MKYIKRYLILLYFIISISNAQSIANKHEYLENQKDIYRQLKNQKNLTIPFQKVKKPKLIPYKKSKKCFPLKKIEENSISLISDKDKQEIFDKFIGKCVTLSDLINLSNMLTSVYIDKGYITSKVYLPPQNISSGTVKLQAIEGRINSIKPDKRYINIVFLDKKDKPLNLRDLETSIKLINRLPSNHATMKLKPAEKVGYSDIIINNKKTKRVNANIALNNFGTDKTGKVQGSFSLSIDDIFGIDDEFSINLNGTNKEFQDENSKGNSFSYSFPTGHFLNTLSYQKTSYKELVLASITSYKSNGYTKSYEYNLEHELFHDQFNSINAKGFIKHTKNRNFIAGALIDISSYNLSSTGLNLEYLHRTKSFYSLLSFGFKKGVNWFGVSNPTDLDEKYLLFNVDLTLQKNFHLFNYALTLHSQYTHYNLFSKDQISIGGAYSVRGYQEEGLNGNSGYYVRNEFSKTFQSKLLKIFNQNYFFAFDGGYIKKEEDTKGGSLFSGSVGIRLSSGSFNTELTYSIPIYKDDIKIAKSFLGFNLSYSF